MIFELIITRKAKVEINKAYIYYETKKSGLGERFIEHLDICFNMISTSPEQFPQRKLPYREAFIKKFPYLVIFEIRLNEIIVYSVFNTWQSPEKKVK